LPSAKLILFPTQQFWDSLSVTDLAEAPTLGWSQQQQDVE